MQITITSGGVGNGTAFVLADDTITLITATVWPNGAGGQIRQGFVNKQQRQLQQSRLLRAAYSLVVPRYNLENRFAFTVQRTFQSVEGCVAFIAFHPDSVPVQGEITIDNQSSTGRIYRYLPNAVIERVECARHLGLACDFHYVIAGNGPWQSSA